MGNSVSVYVSGIVDAKSVAKIKNDFNITQIKNRK